MYENNEGSLIPTKKFFVNSFIVSIFLSDGPESFFIIIDSIW